MIDEFKKSISSILYERTTSPLFGTFLFSWIVWNWKIVLVLFFTNTKELKTTKFEYIDSNLLNIYDGLIYPIISTILILTVYSWLAEQAYRLWLYFDKRKNDHKNSIEKQKLLTLEQSMKLRVELANKEESFEKLIKDKDDLITALKNENSELTTRLSEISNNRKQIELTDSNSSKDKKEMDEFFSNQNAVNHFEEIANYIQHNWQFSNEAIPDRIASYYIAHDLIKKGSGSGRYDFTEKGKNYLKEYFKIYNK